MRYSQLGGLNHLIAKNEEVEIERSLAPAHGSLSAESSLDRPKFTEKRTGLERWLGRGHGVEERALACRTPHRWCFMIRAYFPKVHARYLAKCGDRTIQVGLAVAQVGSQTK
jgi:hypothetical protein